MAAILPVKSEERRKTDMKNTAENEIRDMPETAFEPAGLIMKSGSKTYVIGLHFSESSKDTLEDKVKKLIKKDVESGNF